MALKQLFVLFFVFLFGFFGCAPLQPGYETPAVTITSFDAIPANGLIPQFKIGMHIVNPNRAPLDLKGVAYTITLEGHKILTGVSNTLPHIDPYGEADIELNASVDLFSSIGFFSDLMRNRQRDTLAYRFNAKLDLGTFYPLINVSKEGTFSLSGQNVLKNP